MQTRRTGSRDSFLLALVALASWLLALAPAGTARADDYLDRVNAMFRGIPDSNRSDLVVLPVLANMQPAPAEIRDTEFAMLVTTSHPAWGTLEAWAKAEPQQAVIKAIHDVTREEDFRKAMVFAQGYGVEAVASNPEFIEKGMYTDLGEPPTLAAAKHLYLPAIKRAMILGHIEATRLLAAGDPKGAIDLLFDFLYFARQFADRPFLEEKHLGMQNVRETLVRIRDVAYQDSRAEKRALKADDIKNWIKRLDPEKGYVSVDRLRLPEANLIAAEQLVHRVMIKAQGVNDEVFSATLARISGGDKPLRILSESAYWDRVKRQHADYYTTMDQLIGKQADGGIRADWNRLWALDPFDPLLRRPSAFAARILNGDRFAVLRLTLDGIDDLFPLRMALRAEISGTRVSLGIYGYYIQTNGSWPRDITSIRPEFMSVVDLDPYNARKRNRLDFFVPTRERPPHGPRGEEIPFELRVWPVGRPNFSIRLRSDQFVLYSVGPNDQNDLGTDATQGDTSADGDYLMWPPVISLVRKYLQDQGQQP
ncbi:MAG: hypothetical protein AB7G11_08175 [Phycisphaerales bacterium]